MGEASGGCAIVKEEGERTMIRERLDDTRRELAGKTHEEIDADAAATWAARCVVAYRAFEGLQARDGAAAFQALADAIEYRHEAIEHAAGGPPGTLEAIRAELRELLGF